MNPIDVIVLVGYLFVVVGWGCLFARSSNTSEKFMSAGRSLPGWVVGLSIFGSYVSSISFLANPGKSYGGNWNVLVFALSLPLAAWAATKWYVPFFRGSGEVSAYQHLEHRFGAWARTYGVVCYLLTQLARLGTILYLLALALQPLVGLDLKTIILISGFVVTIYPFFGGSEGVIWTGAIQAIVLVLGVVVCLVIAMMGMTEGPQQLFTMALEKSKFSLGSFGWPVVDSAMTAHCQESNGGGGLWCQLAYTFAEPTILVVFLYGLSQNLQNFGIDQSYVQRYITARSDRAANTSVWMGAMSYIPLSMALLLIGTALWAFYLLHPLPPINPAHLPEGLDPTIVFGMFQQYVMEHGGTLKDALTPDQVAEMTSQYLASHAHELPSGLSPDQFAESIKAVFATTGGKVPDGLKPDEIFPYFISSELPPGLVGLVLAAICSAAMDSNLNCCATLYLCDIHRRYFRPHISESGSMWVLRLSVLIMGALSTGAGLLMIGAKSALDVWWALAGILGGGILGLFLLGMVFRWANGRAAGLATAAGVAVIMWMTWSPKSDGDVAAAVQSFQTRGDSFSMMAAKGLEALAPYRYQGHSFLIPVVGTLVILIVGAGLSAFRPFQRDSAYAPLPPAEPRPST